MTTLSLSPFLYPKKRTPETSDKPILPPNLETCLHLYLSFPFFLINGRAALLSLSLAVLPHSRYCCSRFSGTWSYLLIISSPIAIFNCFLPGAHPINLKLFTLKDKTSLCWSHWALQLPSSSHQPNCKSCAGSPPPLHLHSAEHPADWLSQQCGQCLLSLYCTWTFGSTWPPFPPLNTTGPLSSSTSTACLSHSCISTHEPLRFSLKTLGCSCVFMNEWPFSSARKWIFRQCVYQSGQWPSRHFINICRIEIFCNILWVEY